MTLSAITQQANRGTISGVYPMHKLLSYKYTHTCKLVYIIIAMIINYALIC